MVSVDCPGCGANYSVSEKRIPDQGMKMRCPQCSERFDVRKPNAAQKPTLVGTGPAPTTKAPPTMPAAPVMPTPPPSQGGLGLAPPGSRAATSDRQVKGGVGVAPPARKRQRSLFGFDNVADEDAIDVGGLFADSAGPGSEEAGFGVIDMALPDDSAPSGEPVTDLPVVPEDLDLPQAVDAAGLPVLSHGDDFLSADPVVDLPVAAQRREPAVADGHIDLPSPRRAPPPRPKPPLRPQAAGFEDLPSPAQMGSSPSAPPAVATAAVASELPLPTDADLPMPIDFADLPSPSVHSDLPLPAQHSDLPLPAQHSDLPLPAQHSDLPLPADQDLPLPAPNSDLPLPADFDLPVPGEEREHRDFGDTIELDDSSVPPPPPADQQDPFAAPEPEPEAAPVDVGAEFDLDGAGAAQPAALGSQPQPKVKLKKKRSKATRALLVAVPLVAVAGGMLSMTPLGPYGWHAISDAINSSDYDAKFAGLRSDAETALGTDTAAQARATLSSAQSARAGMARYTDLTAYTAYLAFMTSLRFGADSQDVALGKQILGTLAADDSSDFKEMAEAGRLAVDLKYAEALPRAAQVAQSRANDVDAWALAGEIALAANKPKDALAHWSKAQDSAKSARTLYGQARSHMLLEAPVKARPLVEEVLKISKDHAGARIVLATLLWHEDRRSKRALELVGEVTAKGAVSQAASTSEKVHAFSLLGDIHLSQSHMTDAEKAFETALQLDPQSLRALLGNGELVYQAGRYSEALARFEAARTVDPRAIVALIGKAKTKVALERAKEAKDDLLPVAKTSKHPLVGYWLGQAQEALGEIEAAEKSYAQAIRTGAKNADVVQPYVALADLLGAQGRNDEAAKVLLEASEKLPHSVALHNARGDVALKAGRVDHARQEFQIALTIDPSFTPSRFRLATALRRARAFKAANDELQRVIDADPEYPGLALERGLLFEETGEVDKALAMYNEALKKAPGDVDLKLRVGSTQVVSGHPKQALPLLQEVLGKRPRSAEVNHYLGRALLLMGESPQEALRYLQAAVRYDPNRAIYHLFAGWAANDANQVGAATKHIDKALALDRDLGDAYWQRAVIKQRTGDVKGALRDIEIALEKSPDRAEAYATRALCQQERSDWSSAEASWRAAIKANDSVAEWNFRLGKILIDRGNRAEAGKFLLKAVDLANARKRPHGWLSNANYWLGEALRGNDKKRAIKAFQDFLQLARSDSAYRPDAERALAELQGTR